MIIFRSLIMFLTLFLVIKLLGSKQIKSLTLYDYIISITIGSITADTIISLDIPILNGIIAVCVFSFVGYLVSLLSLHSHNVEEIIDGEPLILFENNKFNYKNLESSKLTIAKFLENCRIKGCFDINDLDSAILEPSGDISILLKNNSRPLTSNDLKKNIRKNTKKQTLNYLIIVDGILNENELKKSKKTKTWLNTYLKENKIKIEEISLLTIDKNDKMTLLKK